MTREEALDWIKARKEHYELDDNCQLLAEALNLAIKALEQEPFINKPCVSSGVCKHDKNKVLDKIRAEISEYGSLWVEYKIEGHSDKYIEKIVENVLKQAKQQVLQIIDKYRSEG